MDKRKEFDNLFLNWMSSFGVSAFCSSDPAAQEPYTNLKEWCKENKKESLQYIKKILEDEPNDIVMILQDLYADKLGIKIEGFMSLKAVCNLWLNVLNKYEGLPNGQLYDYYKDYYEWKEYLEKNYIPWNPYREDNPNVTQEEFKQGKRNEDPSQVSHHWVKFPIECLTMEELLKFKNEGHIGGLTKYIQELSFFYNRIDEEIKRREMKGF